MNYCQILVLYSTIFTRGTTIEISAEQKEYRLPAGKSSPTMERAALQRVLSAWVRSGQTVLRIGSRPIIRRGWSSNWRTREAIETFQADNDNYGPVVRKRRPD